MDDKYLSVLDYSEGATTIYKYSSSLGLEEEDVIEFLTSKGHTMDTINWMITDELILNIL